MKERLVRGTNVREVVQVLRVHERTHELPPLGAWERDLLRKRVAPSTWYALKVFDSLLQVVHRYVFDGSETAGQSMGRAFARTMLDQTHEIATIPNDPAESLAQLPVRWPYHFNFGVVTVSKLPREADKDSVRVRLNGYPDMSATHGQTIVGWAMEIATRAGAEHLTLHIEERPWMHNNVLSFTLGWDAKAER